LHRNIEYYKIDIEELEKNNTLKNNTQTGMTKANYSDLTMMEKYEILCRGDLKPIPREERHLYCEYLHYNNPYLKLGPIKCEHLLFEPVIVRVFHDVIYESEIDVIKKLSKTKFKRATTVGNSEPKFRVGKVAWLYYSDHSVIKNVINRASHMTRLNKYSFEAFQVCNYGIGGQYEPHVDYDLVSLFNLFGI
jgi:prolyl 4-hydroxylase